MIDVRLDGEELFAARCFQVLSHLARNQARDQIAQTPWALLALDLIQSLLQRSEPFHHLGVVT